MTAARALAWCLPLLGLLAGSASQAATVVLDTGHSATKPGARSPNGYQEYAYNRQLTDLIAGFLTDAGVTVIRPEGPNLSLQARTRLTPQADLFVSIHHDSIPQEWIDQGRRKEFAGFAVFVSGKNTFEQKSIVCGKSIGTALVHAGERPSLYHATPMKGENRPVIDHARGLHRFDDLIVLKTARSPAVLVEAGVIAHPEEEIRLADRRVAETLGRAIVKGILGCIGRG